MKDLRGKSVMAGDLVAIGVRKGSCGGELAIREVLSFGHDGKAMMRSWDEWKKEWTRPFKYMASNPVLVLPSSYRDLVDK